MQTPAIEIKNVSKVFNADTSHPVKALDNVSLTINDNEFFTLLGPSGCGKTTLLRLIAGFDYPTSGEINLFGEPIRNLPPQKRSVNTVFQHYALFPHMSVADNVRFPMKMLGVPRSEMEETVKQTLSLVKMADFGDRLPDQLSGGQQQRVALARALAPRPKVLLLDEPLSALDLKLRHSMRVELKNLQRQTGITFVFVTHDQVEALTMSDRIAVMSVGQLQQEGPPVEIYERPVNRFVADFIGDTNFIEGVISTVENDVATCSIGKDLELQAKVIPGKAVNDKVTLVLRPEKALLRSPNEGGIPGCVEECTYTGTDTHYRVTLDGTNIELMVRARNAINGEHKFNPGDNIVLQAADGAARILAD